MKAPIACNKKFTCNQIQSVRSPPRVNEKIVISIYLRAFTFNPILDLPPTQAGFLIQLRNF